MNFLYNFNPYNGVSTHEKQKITTFLLKNKYKTIKITYKQKKKGKGRRMFVDEFRKGSLSINTIMIKRFIEYNGKFSELLYE